MTHRILTSGAVLQPGDENSYNKGLTWHAIPALAVGMPVGGRSLFRRPVAELPEPTIPPFRAHAHALCR